MWGSIQTKVHNKKLVDNRTADNTEIKPNLVMVKIVWREHRSIKIEILRGNIKEVISYGSRNSRKSFKFLKWSYKTS